MKKDILSPESINLANGQIISDSLLDRPTDLSQRQLSQDERIMNPDWLIRLFEFKSMEVLMQPWQK